MDNAPVNVRFKEPTNPPSEWNTEAKQWIDLNRKPSIIKGRQVVGHPGFYPLTIKAAYVIGIIHNLCSTVSYLLCDKSLIEEHYIPAYGIFASGVDLLGRCLQGNQTHHAGLDSNKPDILAGFKWLKSPQIPDYEKVQKDDLLVETSITHWTLAKSHSA